MLFNQRNTLRLLKLYAVRHSSTSLPRAPVLRSLTSPEDMNSAREWIAAFTKVRSDDLPRESLEISYSRSGGAGGQNVNKLSTKATVRLILSASPWIPFYALTNLTTTSYYSKLPPPTGSIILQSSSFRTQPQNLSDGLSKLKSIILGAASEGLIGETSELQKKKVANLEKQEKARTMKFKMERKNVKSGRRSSGSDY